MSFTPDLAHQEQLVQRQARDRERLSAPERLAEVLMIAGFVAVTAALWLVQPPGAFEVWPALLCMALLALATQVEFDTPFGFTVAAQLAFVPLLFAMPVTLVPIAVVVALLAATVPQVASGRLKRARLVKSIGNSWFAIGPVAVFVLAHKAPQHADAGLLAAALAAQFAVDFVSSALRFRLSEGARLVEQLTDSWVYAFDTALSGVGLVVGEEIHRAGYAPVALVPLLGLLTVFARERRTRLQQMMELNHAYHGTALVLGDVIEADDDYTGQHSRSVVSLCLQVAERLELSAERRRNLEFGALLHDVGKIAIPKEIINKPGRLSDDEWTIIRTHTVEGQKLLDTVGGFMRDVGLIVRSHHERWDGGGYPDGLAGKEIPLESRIISCCDTWNAMRTDRSYRRALPVELAIQEMESISGSQLDPRVVTALLEVVSARAAPVHEPGAAPVHEPGAAAVHEPVAAAVHEPVAVPVHEPVAARAQEPERGLHRV